MGLLFSLRAALGFAVVYGFKCIPRMTLFSSIVVWDVTLLPIYIGKVKPKTLLVSALKIG